MQLTEALNLYRGKFLTRFHIRETHGFSEWLLLERERWHYPSTKKQTQDKTAAVLAEFYP